MSLTVAGPDDELKFAEHVQGGRHGDLGIDGGPRGEGAGGPPQVEAGVRAVIHKADDVAVVCAEIERLLDKTG